MAHSLSQLIADNDLQGIREAIALDSSIVNANRGYDQPIHIAAGDGKDEIVDLLLQHGADVNAEDEDQRTPLHRAAELYPEVVKQLLQYGANPNTYDRFGYTPFAWAVQGQQQEGEAIIELLRSAGARYGLLESAAMGDVTTVESILASDTKAVAKEPSHDTLLSMACLDGRYGQYDNRVKVVKLLLRNGIKLSEESLTSQISACDTYGFHEIAALLREYRK